MTRNNHRLPHMSHSSAPTFVFAGNGMDPLAIRRADAAWIAAQLNDPAARFIPVAGADNLLLANDTPLILDTAAPLRTQAECTVLLGEYQGHIYFALGLPHAAALPPMTIHSNLRAQFGMLDDSLLALLGYARCMVYWHDHNRFCGQCGAATVSARAGHELHCTRCDNIIYPRVNPAIITLVTHGDCCLLGHHAGWRARHYSTIAGFVEPGEDPEATLRREVWEETNVRVRNQKYLRSQPWPYPASLMLGYRAEAENADIRCNDGELEDARWFSRAEIVRGLRDGTLVLPAPQSISHSLIREWFEQDSGFSLAAAEVKAPSARSA